MREKKWIGKIVIKVLCDGCMAEDHKLQMIGEVVAVRKANEIWPSNSSTQYDYAVCRVFNSRSDLPDTFFYPCIQDGSFQQSSRNDQVYFWLI
jgi:hypothetical protein